ncbi:hypothetical protein CRX72_16990 [Pantoea sp. BRM17]|nr:hypothetical protein CRX72_16990 [Pantoea sp. BRM17]
MTCLDAHTHENSVTRIFPRLGETVGAFHARSLPVVRVNVAGGAPGRNEMPRHDADLPADWADLVPEMQPQADDICITKKTWGAFHQTDLRRSPRRCVSTV